MTAIALLRDKVPGTFVIRESNSFPGAYGLAVKVAHLPANVQAKPSSQWCCCHLVFSVSVYIFFTLFILLSFSLSLSLWLSVCLSLFVSFTLSCSLSLSVSVSVCVSVCLSVCLSLSLSLAVSFSHSPSLSLYMCFSLCDLHVCVQKRERHVRRISRHNFDMNHFTVKILKLGCCWCFSFLLLFKPWSQKSKKKNELEAKA